ncbi:autophagy-related protein 13-domain-containing protein [Phellopilus nigrolimitatus]|nr:autophagy-related protein 13-domain-containing protein [Phellopilus nigrolimitatus]
MPLDASTLVKADQIAHRFFAKFALVVDNARNVAVQPREDAKTDKWFNLETPDTDSYKEQLRLYRSISQLGASPPPLELQILMSVPELTDKQVLVHHPPSSSRARVDPTPTHILLESWTLAFISSGSASSQSSASSSSSGGGAGEVTLATVYKHAMSVFRSLYTLLRVLPAWRICKRLRRRPGAGSRNGHLGVVLRVRARGDSGSENTRILGFDTPLSPSSPALPTATHAFEPVTHPMGVFALAVTYLAAPHFELDTVEALLSSRFLSLDAGPDFTPTLARNAQRESVSGSPGSLPVRTSLPRSPPQSVPGNRGHGHGATGLDPGAGLGLNLGAGTPAVTSVADRFVLPVGGSHTSSGSRASLPSTSPRARTTALPGPMQVQRSTSAQQPPAAGSGSAGSIGSSSRLSREEGREGVSSIASRVRRESLGMGRGSDLPSAPGPLLIRRQSATVQPFKSSTLSSGSPSLYSNSPSLRHASPLAGATLPSIPGRPGGGPPSPTNTRAPPFRGDAGPSSPVTGGGGIAALRAGSSPVLPLRPSPSTPFAPSSLGERRFPASPSDAAAPPGAEPLAAPPRRKRYSSSFGYRYAAVGSDGSAGSGDKGKEVERTGQSASYLSNNTDDDDISAFVQDIDARKPIGGGFNARHDRERTISEAGLGARRAITEQTGVQAREERRADADNPGLSRHSRTISEGPRSSSLAREAREAATTVATSRAGSGSGQANAMALDQAGIDKRLKELNAAFRASIGVVERRPSSGEGVTSGERPRDASAPPPALTRSPFSASGRGPAPAHMHTPSLSAGAGEQRASASARNPRRVVTTPGGGAESVSVWDNRGARRARADSVGSAASGASEIDRPRRFYGQGHGARGSAGSVGGGSVGSEEVVGRLEMER